MISKTGVSVSPKNRAQRGFTGAAVIVIVKVVCGVALAVIVLQAWNLIAEFDKRQTALANWKDTTNFAIFFPHYNGNNLAEFESGGHQTKIAEARDLYPVLDEAGAVFVDASNYLPGVPEHPWLPASPIRVNTNYLSNYSIIDENGTPIDVSRNERTWVVVVPEQYKSLATDIRAFFQDTRTGADAFDGAVQGQEDMLGEPVPDRFRSQEVRIIWAASGQEIFSFNSAVNPETGNKILDPIIEVMTPANSLTVDRLNSITGDINTPLKVRVSGDSATTLRNLTPILERLGLDDNLQDLVIANDAVLRELSELQTAIAWTAAAAGGALIVMLAFSASFVAIVSDRLRRTFTVRRLHGFGYASTYKEMLSLVAIAGLLQALIASAVVVLYGATSGPGSLSSATTNRFSEIPQLLAVLVLIFVAEVIFTAAVVVIVERKSADKRLKEL